MTRGLPMSEAQLQRAIMELARRHNLLVHHCRAAQVRRGRVVTPISGNPGFPDLVITGPGGTILRELKTVSNQPTPEQMTWLGRLEESGIDAGIWRPEHLRSGVVAETLARLARPRGGA